MTALATYMEKAGLTDEAMARKVGRDRSTITKLRLGQTKPSLDLAVRIAALTDGQVPPTAYSAKKPKQAVA